MVRVPRRTVILLMRQADAASIQVVSSLEDIVVPGALAAQQKRLDALLSCFKDQHGQEVRPRERSPCLH